MSDLPPPPPSTPPPPPPAAPLPPPPPPALTFDQQRAIQKQEKANAKEAKAQQKAAQAAEKERAKAAELEEIQRKGAEQRAINVAQPVAAPPPPELPLDPNVLWSGTRQALSLSKASYTITRDYILFEAGMLSSTSEQIPLWAVRDLDVKQSMIQKSRGIGDVVVHCQHSDYTGRSNVTLEGITDPKAVRDLINREAGRARHDYQVAHQSTYHHGMAPAAPAAPVVPTPAPAPSAAAEGPSRADQVRELAALRDEGLMTDEEFDQKRREILGL